jgi:hypothetical protein
MIREIEVEMIEGIGRGKGVAREESTPRMRGREVLHMTADLLQSLLKESIPDRDRDRDQQRRVRIHLELR